LHALKVGPEGCGNAPPVLRERSKQLHEPSLNELSRPRYNHLTNFSAELG
jgi:hypothetical protein